MAAELPALTRTVRGPGRRRTARTVCRRGRTAEDFVRLGLRHARRAGALDGRAAGAARTGSRAAALRAAASEATSAAPARGLPATATTEAPADGSRPTARRAAATAAGRECIVGADDDAVLARFVPGRPHLRQIPSSSGARGAGLSQQALAAAGRAGRPRREEAPVLVVRARRGALEVQVVTRRGAAHFLLHAERAAAGRRPGHCERDEPRPTRGHARGYHAPGPRTTRPHHAAGRECVRGSRSSSATTPRCESA